MRTLHPQRLTDSTWSGVESQLKEIFFELIFEPILSIFEKKTAQPIELQNAPKSFTALIQSIKEGSVQYFDGEFSGRFNVKISNALRFLGAKYDPKTTTYRINPANLPEFIKTESANYQFNAKAAHEQMLRKLNETQQRLDERLKEYNVDALPALTQIESGFRKSAEALKVQPLLDQTHKEQLQRDYNTNLKIYIKNFSEESIQGLRSVVEKNSMQGYRFDKLKSMIQQRYGVTARKAKFLARQETSLFMSKYRQQRFNQAGVTNYRWSTAHDERVRDDHKRLNGRIFSYDNPPITDRATGARNNPGSDFNCRCLDIPLLDKVTEYL